MGVWNVWNNLLLRIHHVMRMPPPTEIRLLYFSFIVVVLPSMTYLLSFCNFINPIQASIFLGITFHWYYHSSRSLRNNFEPNLKTEELQSMKIYFVLLLIFQEDKFSSQQELLKVIRAFFYISNTQNNIFLICPDKGFIFFVLCICTIWF